MATVTGMTAAAMQAIRDGTVVNAGFDSANHLILTKYDGTQIDCGTIGSASTTLQGVVELATSTETITGTDVSKAVTPKAFADAYAAIPGDKVQVITDPGESALPSAYPTGVSLSDVSTWSLTGGYGTLVTNNISLYRCEQTFYFPAGGTNKPQAWVRHYNASDGGGGWTSWSSVAIMAQLSAASFTQATTFSSYPAGSSRLYYTTANSTGWDFAGMAGEVVTYVDGTDFARQTFTQHVGGSGTNPTAWTRTANSTSGWSNWIILAEDTGWVDYAITGSGYTAHVTCSARRINGMVCLKGAFTAPYSGTANYTTAFILDSQFCPASDQVFAVSSNTTTNMSLQVKSTGEVNTWISAASTAWFSLATARYPRG